MMLELLKSLCAVPGVSGREHKVAEKIKTLMTPIADEVRIDTIGNVIAVLRGTASPE